MTTDNTALERQSTAVEGDARTIPQKPLFQPATDVIEQNEAIVLQADMPGVSEQQVEIHLDDDVLTIRGETPDIAMEGFDQLYREFTSGVYERTFTISTDIDRERITARIKNGVLTVTLPKAEQVKPRKIAIQVDN